MRPIGRIRHAVLLVGLTVALTVGWVGLLRFGGNFHAVEEGVLYRSAQLSFEQFEHRIRFYGIKTVVNLRGENTDKEWYRAELKAASATMVQHIDFRLSAVHEVSDEKLERLAELLQNAPKPILVHCEAGADRSGLASALFELVIAKRPVSIARSQLSLRYGHFPWFGNRTVAMDNSFERFAARVAHLPTSSTTD